MRRAAIAVVLLLLAGCSAPSPVAPSAEDQDALSEQIGELTGVDGHDVSSTVYQDGRQTEVIVTVSTSDTAGLLDLVTAATALIDDAPFDTVTRELRVTIGDSLLSVTEPGGTALDPAERTATFVRWLEDPRVASISWVWQLELELVGDRSTDGSLVEAVYGELADTTTLADGGIVIADPGSFEIETAQHPYTDNRFGLAREIAALDGVSACSFVLEAYSDGSFVHHVSCTVDGDPQARGEAINDLLAARGLLESTDVRLQSPDDSVLTHDGSAVRSES